MEKLKIGTWFRLKNNKTGFIEPESMVISFFVNRHGDIVVYPDGWGAWTSSAKIALELADALGEINWDKMVFE